MAFVKLDCGILNSTLWVERDLRDIFVTALLMATPREISTPMPQYKVSAIEETGFVVPPGWYGFVEAAGPGIVRRAMAESDPGLRALAKLGEPDSESRSSEFEGRRLVRVDGGYVVLNYMKYRDKDATAAARAQRYRDRKKQGDDPSRRDVRQITRDASQNNSVTRDSSREITIAEAEAEAEAHPSGKKKARKRAPAVEIIPEADLLAAGFDTTTAKDFLAHKAAMKAPLTPRAWDDHLREAEKAGWTPLAAAVKVMAKSWRGFEAKYVTGQPRAGPQAMTFRERDAANAAARVHEITGGLAAAKPITRRKDALQEVFDATAPARLG
jgi:hypothetical protein